MFILWAILLADFPSLGIQARQDGRDTPTSGQEALTIPSRLERALIGLESRRWSRRGQPRRGPLAEEGSDMLSCTRGESDQRTRTGDGHPGPRRADPARSVTASTAPVRGKRSR